MTADKTATSEQRKKGHSNGASAATTISRPIATIGEIFADGSLIELISGEDGNPQLMLCDETKETVGPIVEFGGRWYEPATISGSILRELMLPTRCCPHGTTRDLLTELRELVAKFVGLDNKSASLIGRVVLSSAIIEAVSLAPALVIQGPDTARANRLIALLRCLCRHPVSLTGVTPAGFRSLASGTRFTFLISQGTLSDQLQKLLDDASSREQKIPFGGRFLDLFGVQVIRSDSGLAGESWTHRSIEISMFPTGQELPRFDHNVQEQIAIEFQSKLLSFRRANLIAARRIRFDASKFDLALRDLACSLAAATPDDDELQGELCDLLKEKSDEICSEKWTSSYSAAIAAVLVVGHESPGGQVYVSELALLAQEMLRRRGSAAEINPAVLGKILKTLGFTTEPRDAKGKKLNLALAIPHAEQLARDFGVPEAVGG
jgi:hypothetical protein